MGRTRAQYEAELLATGRYEEVRARRAAKQAEIDRLGAMYAQAEEPLVVALAKVGRRVRSVWDLVNTGERYPEAIPILLEHLTRPYPDRILAGIARALAVREAAHAWPQLVSLYRNTKEETNRDFKHGLAVALSATAR